MYIVACKTSPLAYRNPSRHKTVRLGIEAFIPNVGRRHFLINLILFVGGSVPDVQAALREWALTMTDADPELRALLESSEDAESRGINASSSSQQRKRSSLSSGNIPFHPLPVPLLYKLRSNSAPRTARSIREHSTRSIDHNRRCATRRMSLSASRPDNDAMRQFLTGRFGSSSEQDTLATVRASFELDPPLSPICLNDIRKRFSVVDIVRSYQRAASILSTCAEEAVREALTHRGSLPASARRRRTSSRTVCHGTGRVPHRDSVSRQSVAEWWPSVVADYERRLAAGELDYTEDDGSSIMVASPENRTVRGGDERHSSSSVSSPVSHDASLLSARSHELSRTRRSTILRNRSFSQPFGLERLLKFETFAPCEHPS